MKLYKTLNSVLIEHDNHFYSADTDWDTFINRDELHGFVLSLLPSLQDIAAGEAKQLIDTGIQAPIGKQEVWAAGVTYFKSMEARMEESKNSGGADLYDRVYQADRPELFFKALPHRVSGHGQHVNIRKDSLWNVPEPELTLFISSSGKIQAYTIGNDMSSRSIEGENALYLPQAKIYEKSTGLGPCLYVTPSALSPDTTIEMTIERSGQQVYRDHVEIKRMKRTLEELAGYLYRECDFVYGSFLMTGTCLVPPAEFTLLPGDAVHIHIDEIGMLTNIIAVK
jgi:2-dehydro-3-deoxy-D-arabinonate dehydratase